MVMAELNIYEGKIKVHPVYGLVTQGYYYELMNMKKILIIGQAPPSPTTYQEVPYSTTLLYDMLGWVGITKERAQDMFEFEAMTDKFPGYGASGHKPPSKAEALYHYSHVLIHKIANADKIILLGSVAKNFFEEADLFHTNRRWLCLIHPSRRNYDRIMKDKAGITKELDHFLQE